MVGGSWEELGFGFAIRKVERWEGCGRWRGKWEGGGHFHKAAVKLGWVWVELSVGCLPKCSLGGLRIGVEVGFVNVDEGFGLSILVFKVEARFNPIS